MGIRLHSVLYRTLLLFSISALLCWLLLYTDIWLLAVLAGLAAGIAAGSRYSTAFGAGFAGGLAGTFPWMLPLLAPGASAYVGAVGSLASVPGYMLVALTFLESALFVACGGVIGVWFHGWLRRSRAAGRERGSAGLDR